MENSACAGIETWARICSPAFPGTTRTFLGAGYQELQWIADAHPALFLFLLTAAARLPRLWSVCASGSAARPVGSCCSCFCCLAPIVYLISRTSNHYLYEWYLFFTLSGSSAFFAVGADWLAESASRVNRFAPPLIAGLVVIAFFAATQPQRQWLVTHSLQPMRESVLLTRPVLDPYDPRQQSIVTLSMTGVPWSYDPNIIVISDVDRTRS